MFILKVMVTGTVKKDDLRASLVVTLAYISMKNFEEQLITEDKMSLGESKISKQSWPICHKKGFGIARPSIAKNLRIGIT